MRPSRLGLAAGVVYLVLGVVWVVGAHPPGSAPVEILWFAVVAVGGLFVPGLANHVSLARAYLAAPALAYAPEVSGLGFLAVTVALAGLTDLVDGTIARRMVGTSSFGGALDPVVDGVFLGSVAVGLSRGGTFPFWLVAVVIVRYLLPAVVGGALIVSHRPVELRHTLAGQVSTSLIIILLGGIALFRAFGQDTSNVVIAAEIVIPIATVSTFVHLGLTLRRPAANPDPA